MPLAEHFWAVIKQPYRLKCNTDHRDFSNIHICQRLLNEIINLNAYEIFEFRQTQTRITLTRIYVRILWLRHYSGSYNMFSARTYYNKMAM